VSVEYPMAVRHRTRIRKVLETFEGYIRMDIIEDRSFPVATAMRYVAVVFPVALFFFQGSFLHLGDRLFALMLIGTSIAAGLQDALTGLVTKLQLAQERGILETYLVEPVPWALIPVAMNVWRSITGALVCCVMMAFGCVLGADIRYEAIPLALVVLILGIAAGNAVGVLAGSFLILFKRGEPAIALYSLASSVLGGALFTPDVLPGWIRWASYLVPHLYVISAERKLLMQHPPVAGPSPLVSIVILAIFCVVTFAVGLAMFDRSFKLARRLGTLGL
jgi:ABC-2 type transport system permease protein